MSSFFMGFVYPAWRSFVRNLHRYRVLLFALILIAMVLTAVIASVLGMRAGLYEKASRYFSGNVVVLGYKARRSSIMEDPHRIEQAFHRLNEAHIQVETFSRRSTYYDALNIELFFSGYWTKQRRLVGVEWSLERPVLKNMDFVAGGVPEDGDENAVIISTAAARQLNIGVGDELLISIRSSRGRTNTVELIVQGIFSETSFFGYTPYIHRHTLNRLKETPEDQVNEMGLFLENPIADQAQAARQVVEDLGRDMPTFGVLRSREEYEAAAAKNREERHYGVVTVGAQLEEINDLLTALTIIAGAVMLMFLGITVVGVSNTFTMVVYERTKEVGTLRALGMQKGRAIGTFLLESVFLGLSGAVGGILLGVVTLEAVRRFVEFPPTFATTLFLTQGRLRWMLPPWAVFAILGLVVVSSLIGSLSSSVRAGRMRPVEALSHHQ